MNYIVRELQTASGVTTEIEHVLTDPTSRLEAESKYHYILSVAAMSNVEEHAAVILTQSGKNVLNQSYTHPVTTAPVEPPEEPEIPEETVEPSEP